MVISVAPTTRSDVITLVGPYEDWIKLTNKMALDKGYKSLAPVLRSQLNKDQNIQRITLPQGQARQVLKFCGTSW